MIRITLAVVGATVLLASGCCWFLLHNLAAPPLATPDVGSWGTRTAE